MKKMMTLAAAAIMTLSATVGSFAAEAQMPFPQFKKRTDAPNKQPGITPTAGEEAMYRAVGKQYRRYKDRYLRESRTTYGGYYIEAKETAGQYSTLTQSEAHGYGMVIMALMAGYEPNAKKYFDGLLSFYEARKVDGKDLMFWKINLQEQKASDWYNSATGSATDGDLDIAYGLLLAHQQWGEQSYLDKASAIMHDIGYYEMDETAKLPTMGAWQSDADSTRLSDWMAGHFRSFGKINGNYKTLWNETVNSIYTNYGNVANSTTGLTSDFLEHGSFCGKNFLGEYVNTDTYNRNACRVPFRFAADYVTSGDAKAKAPLIKMLDWLVTKTGDDPEKIAQGYNPITGAALDADPNGAFFGPFLAAASCDAKYQAFLDAGWASILDTNKALGAATKLGTEYEDALLLVSMLVMTGNWWTPGDANTFYDLDANADKSGIFLDHFGNTYGDGNAQSHIGALTGVLWGDATYGAEIDPATGMAGGDTTYFKGGGYWYTYNSGGSLYSISGVQLSDGDSGRVNAANSAAGLDYDTVVINGTDTTEYTYMDFIVEDNVLGVNFKVTANDSVDGPDGKTAKSYGYTSLETPLLTDVAADTAKWVDLSGLTSVTLRVRGSGTGELSIKFSTKDTEGVTADASGWKGSYVATVVPEEGWRYIEIKATDINPEEWSPLADSAAADHWGWAASGARNVKNFTINVAENENSGADMEVQIHEIILNGVTYETFGLKDRDPMVSNVVISGKKAQSFSLTPVATASGVAMRFNLVNAAKVNASLYNVSGRRISAKSMNGVVGLNTMNFATGSLANGMYLVRFEAAGNVVTGRFSITR